MKAALIAVFAYALLVAGCAVFQRSLMYFPSQNLPAPPTGEGVAMSEVRLETADGLSLVAWYRAAAPGRATIVYFHGNGGNISHRMFKVRPLMEAGHGLLLVSYRGYGGNPGSPSEEGLFHDGRAAMAFLEAEGLPGDRVVLLGESLGTGVAVRMASEYDVAGVILEAPFTSAADAGKRAYPFLPVKSLIYDRFESLARIDAIDAPLLVVHGRRDRVIPVDLGERLFAAAREPKTLHLLANAGHNDMIEHGLIEHELQFLRSLGF